MYFNLNQVVLLCSISRISGLIVQKLALLSLSPRKMVTTTTWIVLPRKLFVVLLAAASTNDAVALSLFSRSPILLLPSDNSVSAPTPTPTPTPAELSSSVVYRQQQQQQQHQRVPRAVVLRSMAFGGTAFLFGTPTLPVTANDNTPAAQIQAGLADFDRAVSKEANKIDRAVSKEVKKIDRAATKEKKKMTKAIKKETKTIDKKIQKEVQKLEKNNPKVTKNVKTELQNVQREAKKIGSGLEQTANALVGGTGSAVAVPQARSAGGGGGIDVSRVKVCGDGRNKCVR